MSNVQDGKKANKISFNMSSDLSKLLKLNKTVLRILIHLDERNITYNVELVEENVVKINISHPALDKSENGLKLFSALLEGLQEQVLQNYNIVQENNHSCRFIKKVLKEEFASQDIKEEKDVNIKRDEGGKQR